MIRFRCFQRRCACAGWLCCGWREARCMRSGCAGTLVRTHSWTFLLFFLTLQTWGMSPRLRDMCARVSVAVAVGSALSTVGLRALPRRVAVCSRIGHDCGAAWRRAEVRSPPWGCFPETVRALPAQQQRRHSSRHGRSSPPGPRCGEVQASTPADLRGLAGALGRWGRMCSALSSITFTNSSHRARKPALVASVCGLQALTSDRSSLPESLHRILLLAPCNGGNLSTTKRGLKPSEWQPECLSVGGLWSRGWCALSPAASQRLASPPPHEVSRHARSSLAAAVGAHGRCSCDRCTHVRQSPLLG